jgi:hypothetical protein
MKREGSETDNQLWTMTVRTVIDMVSKVHVMDADKALQLQADLCLDSIDWCNQEKHTFLRQRVEARLAAMYAPCCSRPQ